MQLSEIKTIDSKYFLSDFCFFKYLYALGTASETLFKRFWVFDPDKSVEERFRRLLGNTAKQRFEYIQQRFEQSINIIKKRIL